MKASLFRLLTQLGPAFEIDAAYSGLSRAYWVLGVTNLSDQNDSVRVMIDVVPTDVSSLAYI